MMKVGDIVRITGMANAPDNTAAIWPECYHQIGVVVANAMRLHIPAAKVMVLGQVAEFDIDELELVNAEA
jgi:hypothetical protein